MEAKLLEAVTNVHTNEYVRILLQENEELKTLLKKTQSEQAQALNRFEEKTLDLESLLQKSYSKEEVLSDQLVNLSHESRSKSHKLEILEEKLAFYELLSIDSDMKMLKDLNSYMEGSSLTDFTDLNAKLEAGRAHILELEREKERLQENYNKQIESHEVYAKNITHELSILAQENSMLRMKLEEKTYQDNCKTKKSYKHEDIAHILKEAGLIEQFERIAEGAYIYDGETLTLYTKNSQLYIQSVGKPLLLREFLAITQRERSSKKRFPFKHINRRESRTPEGVFYKKSSLSVIKPVLLTKYNK